MSSEYEILTAEGTVESVRKDMKGFKMDNVWYSSWDALKCQRGDKVKFAYKKKGDFKNIVDLDIVTVAEEITPQKASKEEYHLTIEQTRSNALASAIAFYDSMGKDYDMSHVLGTAEVFENYILNGVEKQEVKE